MDRARDSILPVSAILAGVVAVWYVGAVLFNAPFQRDLDRRAGDSGDTVDQHRDVQPDQGVTAAVL